MTLQKLPSGRWRARVWHDGRDVVVSRILGPGFVSFDTKREARAAEEKARATLRGLGAEQVTLLEFWRRWTTDPIFARPKASTNAHNRERTKAFAHRFGSLKLAQAGDQIVASWLAGGRNNGTVPALRAMFNDACSAKAGRLIERNPFAKLGLSAGQGNRNVRPPDQETVMALIAAAKLLSGPSFAAWLQVAAFTGMRPGELDALRWDSIDLERSRIYVAEQWSRGSFTLPKNGLTRYAALTPPARGALLGLARESEFCFVSPRDRTHWTPSSRAYHWKAIKAKVGYEGSLYLATRHFAGSYMTNHLLMPSEDVAIALGHEDGGELVRRLYGHRDKELALDRVLDAYRADAPVIHLKVVER